MSYRELTPHPALRPFVDRYWIRDGSGPLRWLQVLPDGCIDVMLDPERPQAAVVVGTMTRALPVRVGGPARTVAVRFRPGGAAPFLRVSAHQLTDLQVQLGQLQIGWLSPAAVEGAGDLPAAVQRLETALLAQLPSIRAPDPRLLHAIRSLFRQQPPAVEALAADIGWSRQHTARLFQREVGIGPKRLARVARLQWAVAGLQTRRTSSLAQAALDAGYFDQAHMDRDFRELVGQAPAQVRRAASSIRPIASLLVEAEPGP